MRATWLIIPLLSLGIGACSAPGTASAPPAPKRPPAIDRYVQLSGRITSATAPQSMEALYAAATTAQDAMLDIVDGDRTWLETLDDAQFRTLQTELPSLHLVRGVETYVQIDGAAMKRIADAHGRDEDRAFFALYTALWGEDGVPVYLELGRRATPCVRFGEGILDRLYADWTAYAARYPEAYRAPVTQLLADIEEALGLGTCACGDVADVQRELGGFLAGHPQHRIAATVQARLDELRDDPQSHPVRCR